MKEFLRSGIFIFIVFIIIGFAYSCAKMEPKKQTATQSKRTFVVTVYIPQGGNKEYITDDNNVNWSNGFLVFYRGGKLVAVSGTVTMEEK